MNLTNTIYLPSPCRLFGAIAQQWRWSTRRQCRRPSLHRALIRVPALNVYPLSDRQAQCWPRREAREAPCANTCASNPRREALVRASAHHGRVSYKKKGGPTRPRRAQPNCRGQTKKPQPVTASGARCRQQEGPRAREARGARRRFRRGGESWVRASPRLGQPWAGTP
jgi:hypothetical protein